MSVEHRTDLSALSNEMVALYKTQFGRGPTKVRSDWGGDDILIVTLEHSLTPAEQRLVAMGEFGRLRDMRTFFQYATTDEFVEIAERLSGRKVRAFVSGIDTKNDVSSEVFYMHPLSVDGDGAGSVDGDRAVSVDGDGAVSGDRDGGPSAR